MVEPFCMFCSLTLTLTFVCSQPIGKNVRNSKYQSGYESIALISSYMKGTQDF